MLAKVNENSSLPKDASFEKKVEAIDKGIPVYIGSEEEYTAIVKELLKRHKLKLDPEKDYEIYLSIDNDKRVAICLIIDVKTGVIISQKASSSAKPIPILRFGLIGAVKESSKSNDTNLDKVEVTKTKEVKINLGFISGYYQTKKKTNELKKVKP